MTKMNREEHSVFQDRELTCVECNATFVFTASEQEFHAEKGFSNDPKRCPDCRAARKAASRDRGFGGQREMFDAVCSACGKDTKVPFQPRNDRPVYCRECYKPDTSRRSSW
jgi:CxxC-x17-CxxC domain-containing protein